MPFVGRLDVHDDELLATQIFVLPRDEDGADHPLADIDVMPDTIQGK
jgi:hypothetical protein